MAYQSWSVVFGEQPSAAKWNILGSNDSHFNTLFTHDIKTDNNNSLASTTISEPVMKFGWEQVAGNGTSTVTVAVAFPGSAFSTVYSVGQSMLGTTATDSTPGTSITDFEVATGGISVTSDQLTTSGMDVVITSTGTLATTRFFAFSWYAIGI